MKQDRNVGGIADLLAKGIRADFFLEDDAHPLERGLTGLLAFVGLGGDVDHPTGITKKLLRAVSRNYRWVGSGQQE